jgi:hypothetical protein
MTNFNKPIAFILRSPLHRMLSRSLLLITFTGRKSGKAYTTPISYSEHDGEIYAFTRAGWWKNLRGGAPVTLRLRGRDYYGIAEPVEAKADIATGLLAHFQQVPGDARHYGVMLDPVTGPVVADIHRAAQAAVMIRVRLCSESEVKRDSIRRMDHEPWSKP